MKNFVLVMIALFYSATSRSQTFGPDVTVFNDPNVEVRSNFIDVDFNNNIYIGFNYYEMPFRGYRVLKTSDFGMTWQTLIDFSVPGASGWYPQINDMLVAGTDSTNLRVFLGLSGPGNGGPQVLGAIKIFDGNTGIELPNSIFLGDFMTYGVRDIAMCSDQKHPLSSSNPYSVAIAYSIGNAGGVDSLNYLFSDDGLNFTGPYTIDTATNGTYLSLDIAYGSYQNPAVGKFGVSFIKGNNLGVAFTDPGSPTTFSGYSLIDTMNIYTSGQCANPVIAMQSSDIVNSSSDYATVILAEVDNPSNSSTDLVSFNLNDTQNGGIWNMQVVDSTALYTVTPALLYDETFSNFIATYYDATTKELPLIYEDFNFSGNWMQTSSDYPDTFQFTTPTPCLTTIPGQNSIACSWKQLSDSSILPGPHQSIKLDHMLIPVGINLSSLNGFKYSISPNPATSEIDLYSEKTIQGATISIINSVGKEIYFAKRDLELKNRILLPVLQKGIYLVRISDGSVSSVRKLIVM